MRNIKRGQNAGKVHLDTSCTMEVLDLDNLGYPQLEIYSDGKYQISASAYTPAKTIPVITSDGDNLITWELNTSSACKYLKIELISGTYLDATIAVFKRDGN